MFSRPFLMLITNFLSFWQKFTPVFHLQRPYEAVVKLPSRFWIYNKYVCLFGWWWLTTNKNLKCRSHKMNNKKTLTYFSCKVFFKTKFKAKFIQSLLLKSHVFCSRRSFNTPLNLAKRSKRLKHSDPNPVIIIG